MYRDIYGFGETEGWGEREKTINDTEFLILILILIILLFYFLKLFDSLLLFNYIVIKFIII